MNIKPLYDQVVIQRNQLENKSVGGIFLTHSVLKKSHYATVISVGKGRLLSNGIIHPLIVKVGDVIIFRDNNNFVVDYDKDILIISENDILAVVI